MDTAMPGPAPGHLNPLPILPGRSHIRRICDQKMISAHPTVTGSAFSVRMEQDAVGAPAADGAAMTMR